MAVALAHAARSARWLIGFAAFGCRAQNTPSTLDLALPDGSGQHIELAARSAFAEYVELPDLRKELRLTLASYALSCEEYVAPGPEDVALVVTITLPAADPLVPGVFASAPASLADAGAKVTRASSFVVARRGARSFVFPPGGSIELREIDVTPTGAVRGLLAYEFPGDGVRPAAGARGKFDARMCSGQ
jgi:hypothetical protein